MDAPADLSVTLSSSERKLLLTLREAGTTAVPDAELAGRTGEPSDVTRGSIERLRAKRLVLLEETSSETFALTERGRQVLTEGLPERRLASLLGAGPRPKADLLAAGFREEELAAAVGALRRIQKVEAGGTLSLLGGPLPELEEERALHDVEAGRPPSDAEAAKRLVRRSLLVKDRLVHRSWRLSAEGAALPLEGSESTAWGALTPALLRSRAWEQGSFRPYDVKAQVPRVLGVRSHPYREWLRQVEEVLVGLGFEEFRGPLVELEFYNNDVLFMPQEHPARSMHDQFYLDGVDGRMPPARLLRSVAAVHEGRPLPRQPGPLSLGWQTPYREEIARRVVLRSQTTAASARFLASRPKAPFRMYSLDTVFRYDPLDATHLIQFDQCEGVVGKRGLSFRHLLGLLKEFARGIGVPEIRFQPTYFPFTEPSVQGFIKHPKLGWIEALPGGMLRPEVLRPLGIRVPVAAWGIGIGRMAMVALGLSDIRELFLDDLPRLADGRF